MIVDAINITDLNLSFPGKKGDLHILKDIDLRVAEGEVFGLVGESGSGKSTVLRCICSLYDRWTGSILIDGKDMDKSARVRSRVVQMVFQDPYSSLHPKHTINTTLMEPLTIHGIKDASGRVDTVLHDVGLGPSFRFRYPHQLSGGQRQRVAIARALMLEPRILLLDEPTSALDVSVQAEILNLLKSIQRRNNLTCVLVSHDLAVIDHMCDRLAVMREGRIMDEFPRENLDRPDTLHPYTQALIASSRDFDRDFARQLAVQEETAVGTDKLRPGGG